MKSISKKNYILLAILLIISLLLISVPVFDLNFDFRKQAKVGDSDIDFSSTTTRVNSQLTGSFSSAENRYFIAYNSNVWEEQIVPETVTTTDSDNSYFVTKDRTNFSTVYISSQELPAAYKTEFSEEVTTEGLEKFADSLEKSFNLKSANKYATISYVGRELVDFNGSQAIRFEFSEELFGESSSYYEYVVPNKTYYIEVETKSVNKFTAQLLVEDFIKNISFEKDIAMVLGEMDEFNESQSTALVKPSVVSIVHTFCDEIKGRSDLSYLKTYQVCNGAKGSGFFVGDNYIATNGHVVANFPEEAVIANLLTFNPQIGDFILDYIKEAVYQAADIRLTTSQAQEIGAIVLQSPTGLSSLVSDLYNSIEAKDFTIERSSDNHYVGFGNKAFELKEVELTYDTIKDYVATNDSVLKVDLVDYDYGNYFAKETFMDGEKPTGSDVALLSLPKNTDLKLPALPISNASVREGDEILVIGFPGLVSGSDQSSMLLNYDNSSTQATISKGIISSIKQDNGGQDLYQTDASIDHGNSGGPAFNKNSEIIGVATYGFESSIGNFNFLRDIADLRKLADANDINIETGKGYTYEYWEEGLEYFWASRYTKAISQFNKVKKDYPMHPDVDRYIADAEAEIEAGNDVDLLFGFQKTHVIGGIGFVILFLIAAAVLKKTMGSKKTASKIESAEVAIPVAAAATLEDAPYLEAVGQQVPQTQQTTQVQQPVETPQTEVPTQDQKTN